MKTIFIIVKWLVIIKVFLGLMALIFGSLIMTISLGIDSIPPEQLTEDFIYVIQTWTTLLQIYFICGGLIGAYYIFKKGTIEFLQQNKGW